MPNFHVPPVTVCPTTITEFDSRKPPKDHAFSSLYQNVPYTNISRPTTNLKVDVVVAESDHECIFRV